MTTDLKVTVSGSDTGLSRVLGQVERSTSRAEQAMAQYENTSVSAWSAIAALERQMDADTQAIMDRRHAAYEKVGLAAMAVGALISTGLGYAAKAAMDWETAWTGVTKTVDGSAEEMAQLEGDLRRLATTLPFTHAEIAGVAEAAGQLGVARGDVADFTKTVLDMSVSTNLTSEQAATDFARLAAIMQTPISEMDRLGSTAVALGNNFATTEGEIVALGLRLAGAGRQVGLSEAQVFGFSAALSSVGIEAEAGGTAMSQMMAMIDKAADKGGVAVEGFAQVAGMSAEDFRAAWQEDAAGALTAFVAGLGQIQESGGSVGMTLDDLGIKGARQVDTLNRLSGAGNLLAEALGTASGAYDENTALLEESNRFYATSENRLKAAGNQAKDLAIDLGADLLPALVSVGEGVADMVAFVSDLPAPMKTAATVVAVAAAGVTLFGGAALVAIPKVAAFKAAVDGLEAGALRTAGTRLIGLGSVLSGPWGLGLAAATVGLGFFAARQGEASRKVDDLSSTLDEQTGALTDNSREWMIRELAESGALDRAKDLGINLGLVTDAALGNTDALAQLNAELDALADGRDKDGVLGGLTGESMAAKTGLETLRGEVAGLATTSDEAAAKGRLVAEANRANAGAAGENSAAQKALNGTWAAGADEAESLSDAASNLKKAFDELAGGFLSEREASRQVRDSLRDVREAMAKYREEHGSLDGAFKKGTKTGDDFAAMLDGLARDYQDKIAATVEAGASEEKVAQTYEHSRRALMRVAGQMGMSKKAAREYVDQVLAIPELVETDVRIPGAAKAEAELRRLKAQAEGVAGDYYINFIVNQSNAANKRKDPNFPGSTNSGGGSGGAGMRAPDEKGDGGLRGPGLQNLRGADAAGVLGAFASGQARHLNDMADVLKEVQAARKRYAAYEAAVKKAEEAKENKASRLDILRQRDRVRDLERALNAKGKDRLTGLQRKIARLELREERAELGRMKRSGKEARKAQRELAETYASAAKEAERLAKAEAKLQHMTSTRERVLGDAGLVGSSPGGTSRRLARLLTDLAEYNSAYAALAAAGASPWLLGLIHDEAEKGNYRAASTFARRLLADRTMFARIESQGVQLGKLAEQQGSITDPSAPRPAAPSTGSSTSTSLLAGAQSHANRPVQPAGYEQARVNNFYITSNQVELVAAEVVRRLEHAGG